MSAHRFTLVESNDPVAVPRRVALVRPRQRARPCASSDEALRDDVPAPDRARGHPVPGRRHRASRSRRSSSTRRSRASPTRSRRRIRRRPRGTSSGSRSSFTTSRRSSPACSCRRSSSSALVVIPYARINLTAGPLWARGRRARALDLAVVTARSLHPLRRLRLLADRRSDAAHRRGRCWRHGAAHTGGRLAARARARHPSGVDHDLVRRHRHPAHRHRHLLPRARLVVGLAVVTCRSEEPDRAAPPPLRRSPASLFLLVLAISPAKNALRSYRSLQRAVPQARRRRGRTA